MSRSLDAAIEAARDRVVPWDAIRSARIERHIVSKRARQATTARFARWTLGALASAALYAALLHVSRISGEPLVGREPLVSRQQGVPEQRFEEPASPSAPSPLGAQPEEARDDERPVGDGGFE